MYYFFFENNVQLTQNCTDLSHREISLTVYWAPNMLVTGESSSQTVQA